MNRIHFTFSGKMVIAFAVALILAASSCGCIKVVQKSLAENPPSEENPGSTATVTPEDAAVPSADPIVTQAIDTSPLPEITQNLTVRVESALPITEGSSYETLHATRINETTKFNRSEIRQEREPEFQKTYTFGCNATGLLLDVKKGPLIIGFDVEPVIDCMEDPDSCRGSLTKSVNRPYFTITVRHNETHDIVAQDGYGGEYSSEKDDRSITVFGTGKYHVTLEGCFVTADIAIITGNSPLIGTTEYEGCTNEYEDDGEDW